MNLPEIKHPVPESTEADDQALQRLIDRYGVNGLCHFMARVLDDAAGNADYHEASALGRASGVLQDASEFLTNS